jgi:hypothetical protein
MNDFESIEISRLLAEAKELIKQAAKIASTHPVEIVWDWEKIYNNYLYIYKTPDAHIENQEQQFGFDL